MVASLVVEHRLQGAWAHQFCLLGSEFGFSSCVLDAPQHVGSSQIRDRTHISCIGSEFFITEPLGKLRMGFKL